MQKKGFFRQTWVEVDLSSLEHNYRAIRSHLSKNIKVMAAVKANAYGHGIVEVSRKLDKCGIDYFGVASIEEALSIRRAGIKRPILNLGVYLKGDLDAILENDIISTVTDYELAKKLDRTARKKKKKARVHIKIDTGMGRLGIWHKEAEEFVLKLCSLRNIDAEGIYTHFPSADSDEEFTRSQISVFCSIISKLSVKGIEIPVKHLANSMAVVGFQDSHFNLVRPGLALYGLHPKYELLGKINLKPVLSFKSKIAFLKSVDKGRSISYGRTYVTEKDSVIATLPVGYGDGYNRLLSNHGRVLIGGQFCNVTGVVCMDQTMVDVTGLKKVSVEDEVVLIGSQGKNIIRAEDIARQCRTIPYEVVCWISPRVPRFYIGK